MLQDDHLLKLRAVFEDESTISLVTDCYFGKTLYSFMIDNEGILNYRDSLAVVQRILKGLQRLESLNIVHRDIKMQNIVFKNTDGTPDIALIDFGFAINWKELKEPPPIFGTIGYYAPEILRMESFDCRADLYSLGLILFNM